MSLTGCNCTCPCGAPWWRLQTNWGHLVFLQVHENFCISARLEKQPLCQGTEFVKASIATGCLSHYAKKYFVRKTLCGEIENRTTTHTQKDIARSILMHAAAAAPGLVSENINCSTDWRYRNPTGAPHFIRHWQQPQKVGIFRKKFKLQASCPRGTPVEVTGNEGVKQRTPTCAIFFPFLI